MQVLLLSEPLVHAEVAEALGYKYLPDEAGAGAGDILAEIAGRLCYRSWHRPNPATATNATYIANILKQGHFSVLEHAQYVFAITGVSHVLTHQQVRHRHLGVSQVSDRYVDETQGSFVMPLELQRVGGVLDETDILDQHYDATSLYERLLALLSEAGISGKRARQAARYVLPSGQATDIILSGNLRAWREVLFKRMAIGAKFEPQADLEIFHLAQHIMLILHQKAPNAVSDLWERYTAWLPNAPHPSLVVAPVRDLLTQASEQHPSIPLAPAE